MAAAALAQQTEHGDKPIAVKMTGAAEVAGPRFHQWHGHRDAAFQSRPAAGLLRAEGHGGIGTANGAHIHAGAPGKSGDVKVPLNAPGADGTSKGCASVDPAVLKEIMGNPSAHYVNVHTAEFPSRRVARSARQAAGVRR